MNATTTIPARVLPMRFTRSADEIVALYEAIGLQRVLSSSGYAVLAGRGGTVAVHPLQDAEHVREATTSFMLDVDDTAAAVERLQELGVEATWWDESFGRLGEVASSLGRFSLGTQDDTYGYEASDPEPSAVDVVQVVRVADPDAARTLFGHFGFVPDVDGLRLRSVDGGTILLVPDAGASDPAAWLGARIAISTREPLDELTARLRALGHEVEDLGDSLTVPDAEGLPVRVHRERP